MDATGTNVAGDITRRHFLRSGALAIGGAALVRAAPAWAQGAATIVNSELKLLAPNVYAFVQREAPGQSNLSVSNCGIVAGPKSMLAIDATGSAVQARKFVAAARVIGKPFDRVVITHEHIDHVAGLPQFPPVEIIAQEESRVQMAKQVGSPPPPYWTNPAWATPADPFTIIVPDVTYRDRMSLYYGDIEVDLIFPGRAHTLGDTLVKLPREKILFMGDVAFFGVTPLNGSGFVADWIKVCDRILGDPAVQTIVPGHGPVGGKPELMAMRGYLELLLREGSKRYAAGLSPGKAAADIDLGPYATWSDPQRIVANVVRLYSELAGSVTAETDWAAIAVAAKEYYAIKGNCRADCAGF